MRRAGLIFILNLLSALCAFVAAAFWAKSAWINLPAMHTYFDFTPKDGPFYVALQSSAALSGRAALMSGGAALLFAVATTIDAFAHRTRRGFRGLVIAQAPLWHCAGSA